MADSIQQPIKSVTKFYAYLFICSNFLTTLKVGTNEQISIEFCNRFDWYLNR